MLLDFCLQKKIGFVLVTFSWNPWVFGTIAFVVYKALRRRSSMKILVFPFIIQSVDTAHDGQP